MKKLSVKQRVTLLCALLTAAVTGFAMVSLLLGEQRAQTNYYRETLIATARLARDEIFYENGELEIDRNLDDLPNVRVSLFTVDGDLVYGRARLNKAFVPDEMTGAQDAAGGKWYCYDTLLSPGGGDDLWLRCTVSADAANSLRGPRAELLLALCPLLALLAGLGGYAVARRAFRPVERIAATAESIIDGADLKKRIALGGAHDEIYRLANVFDEMLERLERAFERERRFTSDASHELRTPVTAILAQSEFALSDAADEADRTEALGVIRRQAANMSDLLRRLLALARLDARQRTPLREKIDLKRLAEAAAAALEERAEKKRVRVEVVGRDDAVALGDETMLTQAALNLLENAVRYGREGGFARVEIGARDGEVFLSVEDDGPGIPSEALEHVFERFYQVDPARHGEGAGLGLSLVKRVAQLHGGRVEVESRPGAGSRFTICLPGAGEEK